MATLKRPRSDSPAYEEHADPWVELEPFKSLLDENILRGVPAFLAETFGRSRLELVDQERAMASHRGPALLAFLRTMSRMEDPSSYELVFHGTPGQNTESISRTGLDSGRRSGQALGPGEYFSRRPDVAYAYANGCKRVFLFIVLKDSKFVVHDDGDVVVVGCVDAQLPLYVLHVRLPSDESEAELLRARLAEEQKENSRLRSEVASLRGELVRHKATA
jgi:hypothetical protein